jgi:uncharacterized membrane protein
VSRRQAEAGRLRGPAQGRQAQCPERITANAQKIYGQVVATKAMPMGNLTGMTNKERAKIAAWLAAGATQP